MFTALLDTCVLWPSLQRDFLLSLAVEGLYRPAWSEAILEELEHHEAQKLVARGAAPRATAERARFLIEQMRTAFDDALVEGWEGMEGSYGLPYPDDEHVVAAAVFGRAGAIVTHNIKDFPSDRLPPQLTVLRPAEFLLNTVSLDPHRALSAVTEIVRRSGRQGPALTIPETLDLLARRYGLDDAVEVLRSVTRSDARADESPTRGNLEGDRILAIFDVDTDRRALASATFREDGPAIVEIVSGRSPEQLLQHVGTGLLVALAKDTEGAANLITPLVDALHERDDDGDDVLAEQLIAATTGPPTGRRVVPVDLDMLADVLEGDPTYGFGGYLDLNTGQAWPEAALEDAPDDELDLDDNERWLRVPHLGSRAAWRDMGAFADTLTDTGLAQKLADAIEGRGAFSRFRHVLDQHPDQVPGWLAFRDERRSGRARSWLADSGYDALPPSRP